MNVNIADKELGRRDKYTDSIRHGIVDSINYEKCTATVFFQDRDDIVSRELPIMVPCTLYDKWYYMPDIGERVRVLFDPEAPSRGCILGSYYDDTREPPIKDKDKRYVIFKDKTHIEYDRELHKATFHIVTFGEQSVDAFTISNVKHECKETIHEITNDSIDEWKRHKDEEPNPDLTTIKVTVEGNEGYAKLTATNYEKKKDTLTAELWAVDGDVHIKTFNHTTDKQTTDIIIKGQEAKIDIITRNPATGNETAYIKMDGAAKTIDVQGYVTVVGSHVVVPSVIPD